MGERYKMATKETKDVLSGKYGATVKPFNEDVRKKVLGEDAEIITCRPADLIPDELDTLKEEMSQWSQQDEDVLTYALFPQVATDFFKYREAQQTKSRSDSGRHRKRKLSGISEAHIEEITKIREIVWLELRSHNLFYRNLYT